MASHASRTTERLQTRFRDFNFCDIVLKPGRDCMRLDTRWQVQGVYGYQASRQSNVEIGSITSHPPIVLSLETRKSETLGRRLEPLGGYPCRAKSGPSFGLTAVLGHGPLSGRRCRQMMDTPLASGWISTICVLLGHGSCPDGTICGFDEQLFV
jgi:hypothetical protein